MTDHRCVVLHTTDLDLARRLNVELDEISVLHSAAGDELGRVLMGGEDIAVLVMHLPDAAEGRRGWQRIALVHEQIPDLPILAFLGDQVEGWQGEARACPASAVVRAPAAIAEVARVARATGGLPARAPGASPAAPATTNRARAVIGVGGGVGTTTIATLLAARLARKDRTIAVDLDQRHGAWAGTMRATPRYTTYDLASAFDSPTRLDEALPSVLTSIGEDLQLLAARDQPDVVVARAGTGDSGTVLELLRACVRTGDQVVVDLGDLPLALYPVLEEVGEVVVVASHDIRVVRRVPHALAHLHDRAPETHVRTILNRVVSGVEPGPRQLGSLVDHPWDATLAELPAIHHAQNQVEGSGLLDLAHSPPRAVEVAVAALLDQAVSGGSGRARGRRSRFARSPRTEPVAASANGGPA